MKYISFAIPCYNSEAYMEKAINSILVGGEDVEIIVVNDGSKDGTQKIAERYQEKYPTIVKAVEKENGGHGYWWITLYFFTLQTRKLYPHFTARSYRPDTTLIGFPSINCFILSARIETNRCLVSSPFQPICGVKRT